MKVVIAVFTMTAPLAAMAQSQLPEMHPGTRIRIAAPSVMAGRYDATIGARRGDTLVLVRDGMMAVEVTSSVITSAEVFLGKSSALGAVRGAKRGAIVGAITGALVVPDWGLSEDYCEADCNKASQIEEFLGITALGALYGAAIGAIVRSDKWRPLQLAPSRVSVVAPSMGQRRVGLRIAF